MTGRRGSKRHARGLRALALAAREPEPVTTTRLNLAEVYSGVERAPDPTQGYREVARVLRGVVVLDLDDAGCRTFGQIDAFLSVRGIRIGEFDTMIAAIALVNSQAIITRNSRHFQRVPGLRVITY